LYNWREVFLEKSQNIVFYILIMKEIESVFKNCTRYEIFTGLNGKNTVALYKKLGYVETSVKDVDGVFMVFMKKDNK